MRPIATKCSDRPKTEPNSAMVIPFFPSLGRSIRDINHTSSDRLIAKDNQIACCPRPAYGSLGLEGVVGEDGASGHFRVAKRVPIHRLSCILWESVLVVGHEEPVLPRAKRIRRTRGDRLCVSRAVCVCLGLSVCVPVCRTTAPCLISTRLSTTRPSQVRREATGRLAGEAGLQEGLQKGLQEGQDSARRGWWRQSQQCALSQILFHFGNFSSGVVRLRSLRSSVLQCPATPRDAPGPKGLPKGAPQAAAMPPSSGHCRPPPSTAAPARYTAFRK